MRIIVHTFTKENGWTLSSIFFPYKIPTPFLTTLCGTSVLSFKYKIK